MNVDNQYPGSGKNRDLPFQSKGIFKMKFFSIYFHRFLGLNKKSRGGHSSAPLLKTKVFTKNTYMKLILTILFSFLILTAEAQLRQCQIKVRDEIKRTCVKYGLNNNQINILYSLALRESSFDPDTFNVIDKSAGLLGERKIFVRDANRILGYNKFIYTDRYSLYRSIEMAIIVINHYVPDWDHQKICNRWNKGSDYWNNIQKEINIARN